MISGLVPESGEDRALGLGEGGKDDVGAYVPGLLPRRGWHTRTVLAEREMGNPAFPWLGPHGHFLGYSVVPARFSGGNKPAYCVEMTASCANNRGGSVLGPMCVYRPGGVSSVSTVIKIWTQEIVAIQ